MSEMLIFKIELIDKMELIMARPVEITQQHIDFIKRATEARMTVRAIAEQIGFCKATVNKVQKQYGFKKPKVTIQFNNY